MKTPRLETKRLILREVRSDDADSIYKCWTRLPMKNS
jgi:RimJ/RimL family protein N-acetyltransferase